MRLDFSSKIKLSHSSVFVINGYIFNKKSRNKKRKLNIRPGDKTYDNKFIDPWSDSIVTVVKTVPATTACSGRNIHSIFTRSLQLLLLLGPVQTPNFS